MEQAGQPEGCCNNFPEESQTWLAIPTWRNACICPSHWCQFPIKTSKVSICSSLRPTLAHDTLDHWSFSHSCGLRACPIQERHTCYLCSWEIVCVQKTDSKPSYTTFQPPQHSRFLLGNLPGPSESLVGTPLCVPITPWPSRSPHLSWFY